MLNKLLNQLQHLDRLFPPALSGARTLIGLMWLLSLRWKLPPTFAPAEGRGLMERSFSS